jgi:diguanylate cyclase (GGDEF)-like protein
MNLRAHTRSCRKARRAKADQAGNTIMEPVAWTQILEASFGLMSAGVGVAILFLARRIAPALTFFLHRRLLYLWVLVGALLVASQFVGALSPLFRSSTFTDIVEELVELAVLSCVAFALYMLGRVEREEVIPLRHSAEVDALTGLSNRSFFYRAAARRVEMSKAHSLPLACIVLDVDNFKDYNDSYGHAAGDRALRCVAKVVHESLRADDIAARYGGEEFVLLLSGDLDVALEVAERLRFRVEIECTPEYDASLPSKITVSLGVASLDDDTATLDRLLEAADREMYRSKGLGKNRVSVAGDYEDGLNGKGTRN